MHLLLWPLLPLAPPSLLPCGPWEGNVALNLKQVPLLLQRHTDLSLAQASAGLLPHPEAAVRRVSAALSRILWGAGPAAELAGPGAAADAVSGMERSGKTTRERVAVAYLNLYTFESLHLMLDIP